MSIKKRLFAAMRRARLRERLFAAIGRTVRPEKYTEDASGREHKGKGEGGGQFVSKGGGGGSGGDSRTKIGKGSTGDVFKSGTKVIKSAYKKDGNLSNEGRIYARMAGVPGVADGKQVDDEIHVNHYDHIISIDAIEQKRRKGLGPLIAKSVPRIYGAVSALSAIGGVYGDQMQFGMNEKHELDLLDFSEVTKDSPENAAAENMNMLGIFFDQFGLEEEGKRLSKVMTTITGMKEILAGRDSFGTYAEDIGEQDVRKLTAQLDGKTPRFAYYAKNARHVGIRGVAQTEHSDGIKVLLSDTPIGNDDINKWELTPVLHPATAKEPATKAA